MAKTGRTMSDMTWWEYVQSVSKGATNVAIAELVGITPSSVGKWKSSTPHPTQAAAFARAVNRPVLEAFLVAGFLTEEDLDAPIADSPLDITTLDDDELVREVSRRLKRGARDGWQPEAEKMILVDGGADGESEEGGRPTSSGQSKRGVTLHGRAPRNRDRR